MASTPTALRMMREACLSARFMGLPRAHRDEHGEDTEHAIGTDLKTNRAPEEQLFWTGG